MKSFAAIITLVLLSASASGLDTVPGDTEIVCYRLKVFSSAGADIVVKLFPSVDAMDPFYVEIADLPADDVWVGGPVGVPLGIVWVDDGPTTLTVDLYAYGRKIGGGDLIFGADDACIRTLRPPAIFSDGFESGSIEAWSSGQ